MRTAWWMVWYVMVEVGHGVEVTMLWGDVCDHAIIVSAFGNRTSVLWVHGVVWISLVCTVSPCSTVW